MWVMMINYRNPFLFRVLKIKEINFGNKDNERDSIKRWWWGGNMIHILKNETLRKWEKYSKNILIYYELRQWNY
jgi:hypothetical protein